ncbi:MAG: hypothetical protein KGS61_06330, partial [Verrucomicrobia bacterium]|nr:hypothetical protein [Verrucomicrobiota bacterium]
GERCGARVGFWSWLTATIACGSVASAGVLHPILPGYRYQRFGQRDGLPDTTINAIYQTRDGYLWLATPSGLARFDGTTFEVHNRDNTRLMTNMDCTALAEDRDGILWIGTQDGLLTLHRGEFSRIGRPDGMPDSSVSVLCTGVTKRLWIGLAGGLCYLNRRVSRVEPVAALNGKLVFAVVPGHQGVLWVGASDGLYQLEERTGQVLGGPESPMPDWRAATAVSLDSNSEPWVLFANPRWDKLLYHRHQREWIKSADRLFDNDGSGTLAFLLRDREQNLWLPTEAEHLIRWHDGSAVTFPLPWPTSVTFAQCAWLDREGSIWVGAFKGGLFQLQPAPIQTYTTANGLPDNSTWVVYPLNSGGLWVGTEKGLSRLFDGTAKTYSEADGLPRHDVRAIAQDNAGRLWVGTGNGLAWLDRDRFVAQRYHGPVVDNDHYEIGWNKIRAILAARDGSVWVAIPRGLHHLHAGQDRLFTTADGLSANDVCALLEDRAGNLWCGTDGGGLDEFHAGHFTVFSTRTGLSNDHVRTLYEDAGGVLWVGTEMGLDRFQEGRFTVFTSRQGLCDYPINRILEDDFGDFWISTENGIYRVKRSAMETVAAGRGSAVQATRYDESDGMPTAATNGGKCQPAGWKTADGRLWFPTPEGLVSINPRRATAAEIPPPVVIEQVRADNQIVYGDDLALNRRGGAGVEEGILRIRPGLGHVLEFAFNANSLINPGACRFKYRLEGYQDEWIDVATRRVAYYTNLSPGRYRFHVIACNHQRIWNLTGASLAFDLEPFYYQTAWFRAAVLLALAGLVYALFCWRVGELRRIQGLERHAALVDERNRMAKDLHDGVGAVMTELGLLTALTERDLPQREATEAHLRQIRDLTQEASQTLRDIVWLAHADADTLDSLVGRVCLQVEQLLRPQGIRCRFNVPHLPAVRLKPAAAQGFYLAAKEALNNVAKHANATEVAIHAACQDHTFKLTIEDNGCGFRLPQPGQTAPNPTGHGFPSDLRLRPATDGHGLRNMRQRLESIGGTFSIAPRSEGGTTVSLALRLDGGQFVAPTSLDSAPN